MTENEAIKHLQSYAEVVDNMIKYCKDFEPKADITGYLEKKTVFAMAIYALKEIQKYREMGRKLREAYGDCEGLLENAVSLLCDHEGVDVGNPIKARLLTDEDVDKWEAYKSIGTVEECREAVEKQKAKKPVLRNDNGRLRKSCPVCGCFFSPLSRSCPKCGQAIDKNLEGMEE